jgi:DNA-binding CsgD family transcriptional regulator
MAMYILTCINGKVYLNASSLPIEYISRRVCIPRNFLVFVFYAFLFISIANFCLEEKQRRKEDSVSEGVDAERVDELTPREREMVILVAKGMMIKQIAPYLQVSEKTVRNHMRNIYRKLALYDRSQLVIYALKNGLVDINTL